MHRLFLNFASGLRALPLAASGGSGATAGARGAAFVALAGGSVAYLRSYPAEVPAKDPADSRLLLARPVMEMLCGAVGEVAQVCVLYPLETVKVKCQAEGMSAAAALAALVKGGPAAGARALYAGVGAAALCSVIVGAVHYASFCVSKRAATAAAGGAAGAGDDGGGAGATAVAALVGAVSTALVESPVDRYRHLAQAGLVRGNFLAAMASDVAARGPAALYYGLAAFCAESLPYDVTELGVYGGLADAREAALAAHAAAAEESSAKGGGQRSAEVTPETRRAAALGRRLAAVPPGVLDAAVGAMSGAAAVLVSMPFDVIKTQVQVQASVAAAARGAGAVAAAGPAAEIVAFIAAGRALVAARGPAALFTGLAPRLVQQVPSSMLCWATIERARAALEPFTRP